jgi:hypothetical protein
LSKVYKRVEKQEKNSLPISCLQQAIIEGASEIGQSSGRSCAEIYVCIDRTSNGGSFFSVFVNQLQDDLPSSLPVIVVCSCCLFVFCSFLVACPVLFYSRLHVGWKSGELVKHGIQTVIETKKKLEQVEKKAGKKKSKKNSESGCPKLDDPHTASLRET